VELVQSGAAARGKKASAASGDVSGVEVVDLERRAFTLRFRFRGIDHIRVFATLHKEDLDRDNLFCAGCGMADDRGNKEWGLLMPSGPAEERMGFNYWHYHSPEEHRCDAEPTPNKERCWRTVWRVNDTRLEDFEHDRLYLVVSSAGPMDPKTYERKETHRRVFEIRLPKLAPKATDAKATSPAKPTADEKAAAHEVK
jgi:hypothetical protein